MVERRNDDLECWTKLDRAPVRNYFSSDNDCLLAYVFTGGNPQLEWSKRNESTRIY